MKILLIIDTYGWAFHNITQNIIKYNTKYEIYVEEYKKIDVNKYLDIDHVIFFWYDDNNNKLLSFFKNRSKTVNLCIYDYSTWIETSKLSSRKNMFCFLTKINNYLYSSPYIIPILELTYPISKKIKHYPIYDGVDIELFAFKEYNKNIFIKDKLTIGWIGNSNPNAHGINKGFVEIKNIVDKMKDMFIFKPQDSYTGKYIEHSQIPHYIYNIDIIVCYSKAEGTPNQILECSSCGRCWISTKVGIVEELQKNSSCGILIERNKDSLQNALVYLYHNRHLLIQYGINGRKNIEKNWNWKDRTKQFFDFFKKLE
jgi:glycosyltransferase involved in cell wall biosynthesis